MKSYTVVNGFPMHIPLTVVNSDAFSITADLAVIGPTPSIKNPAEVQAGAKFEKYGVDSEMLTAPQFVWKHTLALRYDSDPMVRKSTHQEIHGSLSAAVHNFRPKTVLMVPFSWRHPDTVAQTMLFHLWALYASEGSETGLEGAKAIHEITIVAKDDVAVFQNLLNSSETEKWIKKEYEEIGGLFRPNPVDFKIET